MERPGRAGAVSCVSATRRVCFEGEGDWGGSVMRSSSQYSCRLEDVRLLWLAVPGVTGFEKQLPRETSSLQASAARRWG